MQNTEKKTIKRDDIIKLWDVMSQSKEGKRQYNEMMRIFELATAGSNKKYIYISTFQKAKNLYNKIIKLHKLQDRLLELDNDYYLYNSDYTKKLHLKEEKQEAAIKKELNYFNLKTVYYSWRLSIETKDRRQIYIY